MLHPSYKELMEKVNENNDEKIINSRYSVVVGTAKRARQISEKEFRAREKEGFPPVSGGRKKPLSAAVEEFMDDKVHIVAESSDTEED